MQKTLKDMAKFLKEVIPHEIPKDYSINPMFLKITNEKKIREGVLAFRNFLYRICDRLIEEDVLHGKPKKEAHEFMDRTSINTYFPFLSHISNLLMNIGFHGKLNEDKCLLVLNNTQNNLFPANLNNSKKTECFKFLVNCGINFTGFDFAEKNQDFSKIKNLEISYPENSAMLIGLKTMAIAQNKLDTSINQNIFLRCDYTVIKNEAAEILSAVKDIITPLPADVQKTFLKLHKHYMDKGLNCFLEIKDFWFRFIYANKKKEIWFLGVSMNNGYQIVTKTPNSGNYIDEIKNPKLKKMIAKGFGCGKKKGTTTSCDGGCRGYRITLDDSFVGLSEDIKMWLDKELEYLQKK